MLITAEVGGRIQSLVVDEGQEVAAGQTLALLDTALLEAQLDQARAAVGGGRGQPGAAQGRLAAGRYRRRPGRRSTRRAPCATARPQPTRTR